MQNTALLNSTNIFTEKVSKIFKLVGFEGFIWIMALLSLAFFINPFQTHFTICPLSNIGFENCPGCGLGNSIALIFQGNFSQSFNSNVLGIPALIIILHRVFSIIKFNLRKEQNHK